MGKWKFEVATDTNADNAKQDYDTELNLIDGDANDRLLRKK